MHTMRSLTTFLALLVMTLITSVFAYAEEATSQIEESGDTITISGTTYTMGYASFEGPSYPG